MMRAAKKNRHRGFTVVELLVVTFILGILMAAIFQVLNVGQTANAFSAEKVYLQSELRRVLDWIVRDARQGLAKDIGNYTPSESYLRFQKVIGYRNTNNTLILDDNFIEYDYDSESRTIKRSILDQQGNETGKNWTFYNITEPPFYTRNDTGAINPLSEEVENNNNLVVRITGQRVKRSLSLNLTLQEEVKIRNRAL